MKRLMRGRSSLILSLKTRAEKMMPAVRTIRILFFALAAGCAGVEEPPLDVAALKARLRDTSATGTFTKLALKNQVDDLLKQFQAHYQSGQKTKVDALRQPYDMLVLKVLALIQDSDPSLARTISGSREAIWAILADREKFRLEAISKIPSPPVLGERARVRGQPAYSNLALETEAASTPHPNPLPAAAGRGSIFETTSSNLTQGRAS